MTLPTLKIKSVIFDLDGTLLDTAPDIMSACNYTLKKFGYPEVAEDILRTKVTAGMREMLKLGVPAQEHESAGIETVMRSCFAERYTSHICDRTVPFAGIPELLADLKNADIKFAVVTNKYKDMAFTLLRKFDFFPDISLILGCDSLTHCKPHPEPILKAMEILQSAPYESLYVGDHLNDIMAANRAKTFSAAALWGYGGNECADPTSWHAHYMLHNTDDLRTLLLGKSESRSKALNRVCA